MAICSRSVGRFWGGSAGNVPANDRQLAAGLNSAAFGGEDLSQNTSGRGGHVHTHFIGFQFTKHFVLRHSIAGLFVPDGDGGLSHRFAQDRHHHWGGLRGRRWCAFGGGRGRGAFVDLCQQRLGADGCTLGGDNFCQCAGHRAGHFDGDLISL